jgi:hypothetical protein
MFIIHGHTKFSTNLVIHPNDHQIKLVLFEMESNNPPDGLLDMTTG